MSEATEYRLDSRASGGSLGPPQFGLRGLFLWVTGLSLLFGAMAWAGAIWAMMFVLAALLIAGHVGGAALATKLRDRSTSALKEAALKEAAQREATLRDVSGKLEAANLKNPESIRPPSPQRDLPPPSTLCFRVPLCRTIHWMVTASAIGGGVLSGWALIWFYSAQISIVGLLFGSISAAVICGWFGLLSSTFVSVTHRAWREAVEYHDQSS